MKIEPKGAKTMRFKLEHCKPENHEASKKVIFKGSFFQEEKPLKRGCMTLNNNFLWKWQIFDKRKNKQNTRKLWVFGSKKISSTFLHEIFLKNPFKKVPKLFPPKKNLSSKRSKKKILKEGFQKFSKNSFKEKCPFPKSSLKILKSLSENLQKSSSKIIKKSPPESQKSLLFSQHKPPFYRRRFRKYFQTKKPF